MQKMEDIAKRNIRISFENYNHQIFISVKNTVKKYEGTFEYLFMEVTI